MTETGNLASTRVLTVSVYANDPPGSGVEVDMAQPLTTILPLHPVASFDGVWIGSEC